MNVWYYVAMACMFALLVLVRVGEIQARKQLKKKEFELYKAEKGLAELGDKLARVKMDTDAALETIKGKPARFTRLNTYSVMDADFLNKVAEVSELPQIKFVLDAVHREIYEAALTATSDGMILNAIGKGKGVRVIERKLQNPASLYTEEIFEEEAGDGEV